MLSKRNAFGTWLLVGLTIGIYGLVMYERLNRELHEAEAPSGTLHDAHPPVGPERTVNRNRPAWSRWWSQFIPVYGIVGIHRTALRVNMYAGHKVISPTASWLWWSWFFVGSYPYLQIGANRAADRVRFATAREAAEAGRG